MAHSRTGAVHGHDLQRLQRRRKQALRMAALGCVALLLVTDSGWLQIAPDIHLLLQGAGLLLVLVCLFGRTWCALYIGGLKKRELVTRGPYSIVRNPLYVFTILGAAAVGLLAASLLCALLFAALALSVFSHVARQEEAFLEAVFGQAFRDYAARVPRFWPRFSAWQDADVLHVNPRPVMRTFLETSLFLLAVPLVALKAALQASGWLPIALHFL
jgi:protein-S-isoprenylcysteine O-methyltransferase Ste14